MSRLVAIIQGHPDPVGNRFCHALADAYAEARFSVDTRSLASSLRK
jgi:hypothetical protein